MSILYTLYTNTVCKRRVKGFGPQTDKHLPQCPFTGQFIYFTIIEHTYNINIYIYVGCSSCFPHSFCSVEGLGVPSRDSKSDLAYIKTTRYCLPVCATPHPTEPRGTLNFAMFSMSFTFLRPMVTSTWSNSLIGKATRDRTIAANSITCVNKF
jgi:hypothetical protein